MNSPLENIYRKILKIFNIKVTTNGHDKLLNKIASGKEVFFENTFEEFVFRSIPKGGYEAKQKGKAPYLLTNTPNKLVDAILEGKIITKEEYENY
jgi:hypothetical protein